MKYIRLLRIRHYIKNLLIFVPLFFSGQFFDGIKLLQTLVGAILFCMVTSAVYIINDIKDVENDRLHPLKKYRPIASGEVSISAGWLLAAILVVLPAVVLSLCFPIYAAVLVIIYFILNLAYSFGLKDKALLDVCILVSGFLIRVLFGGVVSQIEVSSWLYLTIISLSFYLALGKRRNELVRHGDINTRNVLKIYTREFLDKNMYMCMGLANGFYALWVIDQPCRYLILTVPMVLILSMRYSMIIEGSSEGDPVDVLLGDRLILVLGTIYALYTFAVLYFK